jgi:hypothetical protein
MSTEKRPEHKGKPGLKDKNLGPVILVTTGPRCYRGDRVPDRDDSDDHLHRT